MVDKTLFFIPSAVVIRKAFILIFISIDIYNFTSEVKRVFRNWVSFNSLPPTHLLIIMKTQQVGTVFNMIESAEKSSAIWTYSATTILLKLYENKLKMLKTPKKKRRIWLAISDSLRDYNIEMTADQVRWKINALTKKYKQCKTKCNSEIQKYTGQPIKFKYFKEMDDIHTKYKFALTELIQKKNGDLNPLIQTNSESKAMIELRKVRLANRIESDRTQSKLKLEKQWLEYLNRQEQNRLFHDEVFERNLRLREEELELRRQKLEMNESIDLWKLQSKEKEQNELLKTEKEKYEMLKQFLDGDVS